MVGDRGLIGGALEVATAEKMLAVGRRLATQLHGGDVLVLDGDLGAGKTTLTRGLGEALGVRGAVTSPTFVIARHHPPADGDWGLLHVDAYRLGGGVELDDADLDAGADAVTVIEWGAAVVDALTSTYLLVRIERERAAPEAIGSAAPDEQGPRLLHLAGHGPQWPAGRTARVRAAIEEVLR